MKILSFIKPKSEVVFVYRDDTVKDALAKLEKTRFSSIPILDREGYYVGTLAEGDLLWGIKEISNFNVNHADNLLISNFKRHRDYLAINIDANMDELISKAMNENFVPVVDSHNLFIGIVTRKSIINYFLEHNFIVL
ncbi:MAG: CBS domain-containing protein [Bacilli bacterium]|jgi:CBS domain-containing protein|nr:CBS domain-containing protein [Bacilli bacterium]MDY0209529.1 CBS domain-containing protein [Bacilli bacterium]